MPEMTVPGMRYAWTPAEERYGRAIERLEDELAEALTERDRYREALVLIYGEAPPLIARVCDEIVDRSGRLLGELRREWRALNQSERCEGA